MEFIVHAWNNTFCGFSRAKHAGKFTSALVQWRTYRRFTKRNTFIYVLEHGVKIFVYQQKLRSRAKEPPESSEIMSYSLTIVYQVLCSLKKDLIF